MGFNFKNPKSRITIAIISIVGVVLLFLGANFVRHNITESKIKESIKQGTENLTLGKFSEARENFEGAVLLKKDKRETYISIKDEYIKVGRLDDALAVLKAGKTNNIIELDGFIEEIKGKFEETNLEAVVYQNNAYTLPEQAVVKINNENTNQFVKWQDIKVDTSKLGDFVFQGIVEEYEKQIKLTIHIIPKIVSVKEVSATIVKGQEYNLPSTLIATLSDETIKEVDVKWLPEKVDVEAVGTQKFVGTVKEYEKQVMMQVVVNPKPVVKSKLIGYVSKVYQSGGKRYLSFDQVQFLTGDEAVEAAKKDGNAVYEDGKYYVFDGYYIVNNNKQAKTYVIADNASLNVLGLWLDIYNGSIENQPVSFEKFSSIASKNDHMLCHIYLENDVVVRVEGQYTP